MKILISGASGLIGRKLKLALQNEGHEVWSLTRSPKNKFDIFWNPNENQIELEKINSFQGVIHLAGENIAGGSWTEEKKKKIYSSRVEGTRFLVDSILSLPSKPDFFVSASAVGYYGDRGDESLNEASPAGSGFLAKVCIDWEEAAKPLQDHSIRSSWARIGIVLSPEGGALQKMLTPFRLGLGGNMGSGQQWFPWIDIDDLVQGFCFLVKNSQCSGAFNFTAPEILLQKDFAKTLARHLKRPSFFHAPEFLLKLALGEMGEDLLLASMKVLPERLLEMGFEFKYPSLEKSLEHLLSE